MANEPRQPQSRFVGSEAGDGATNSAGRRADVWAYLSLLDLPPVALVLSAATGFSFAAAHWRMPAERLAPYLVALLLTQFAIAFHNHYCDRHHDAIAHPERAIPRGLLVPRLALGLAWGLFGLGLLVGLLVGPVVAGLVALGTGAAFVYNGFLKRTVFSWLPYWVALPTLVVCSFAVAGRVEPRLWTAYVLGLPLVLAIHLVDALSDVEADRAAGLRGLAHRLGEQKSRVGVWLSLGASQALALALWAPRFTPGALFYLSLALLPVAIYLGRGGARRGHWLAAMACALALALAWVADLAAS